MFPASLILNPVKTSPSLPASCNWIFSISIGVVTTTWQVPAPHPASTSPHSGNFLQTENSVGNRNMQAYVQ